MNFPEKLTQLMEDNALTNYRLAKSLDVHASTVANWRAGKTTPNLEHIKHISEYFGIPYKEIIQLIN